MPNSSLSLQRRSPMVPESMLTQSAAQALSTDKQSKQMAVVQYLSTTAGSNTCDLQHADIVSVHILPEANGKCEKAAGKEVSPYGKVTKDGASYAVEALCNTGCTICAVNATFELNKCDAVLNTKVVNIASLDSCGTPGKKPSAGGKPVGAIAGGAIGGLVLIAVIGVIIFKRRSNRVRYAQIN